MRSALVLAGLALASCAPQPEAVAIVPADRELAFVALVEQTACQVDPANHEAVHAAGFSDAEIDAIGQQLIAEGRAELSPTGQLILLTENCL
jgi:hypothetical protein